MVQKWNMHFSSALKCEANAQGPLDWKKGCFWKFGPRIFRLYRSASFFEANNFRKNGLPTNKDNFSGNQEAQIYGFGDFYVFKGHGNWSEMGPYGSIWTHIKTGRSHMAQDHFKTPPGPKRGYMRPNTSKKSLKVRAKPAKPWVRKNLHGTPSRRPPLGNRINASHSKIVSFVFFLKLSACTFVGIS